MKHNKIKSTFGEKAFYPEFYKNDNFLKTTSGSSFESVDVSDEYKGRTYSIDKEAYYYKKNKGWIGLPYIIEGYEYSNTRARYLKAGNKIVHTYNGGQYNPSTSDQMGVITSIEKRTGDASINSEGKMQVNVTCYIEVRNVKKDGTVGNIFHTLEERYTRLACEITGKLNTYNTIDRNYRFTREYEKRCADLSNVVSLVKNRDKCRTDLLSLIK